MDTMLALIFLGSVFYAGKVILEYIARSSEAKPRIEHLEAETQRFADASEQEAVLLSTIRERAESVRQKLRDLRDQTRGLRRRVESERARETRLQVALYRQRIRRSRQVLVP